jgi:hypothetical protein
MYVGWFRSEIQTTAIVLTVVDIKYFAIIVIC